MESKTIKSWEEFEREVIQLFLSLEQREKDDLYIPAPLFRGQNNADWKLETTLDRIKEDVSLSEYHSRIKSIKPSIETCTGLSWDILPFKEPEDILFVAPQPYEFMTYLRHHKFPSPLLDWTRSPYIAAYFAFNNIYSNTDVAIFVYIEHSGAVKSCTEGEPNINVTGSYVTTHKRHYLQQSEYTICTRRKHGETFYCKHEYAFAKKDPEQNILKKYVVPISERVSFLKKLDLMNINAYSLFDSVESLADTLAAKNFFIKNI